MHDMSYLEMHFIQGARALKTGVGARWDSDYETLAVLESAKMFCVSKAEAEFTLDHYDDAGRLLESVPLSRRGFEIISGEEALSAAEYVAYDTMFWTLQKAAGA